MSRLLSPNVENALNSHWDEQLKAIDGYDATFIFNALLDARPQNVVEIGCASGFSTALMAKMLEEIGPASITSYDVADKFWMDPSKEVGYLVENIAKSSATSITVRRGKLSLDICSDFEPGAIDFAFIDANHQHPWPLIDTLAILPLMSDGAYIVHHDLQLYRDRDWVPGIGPKVLYDQIAAEDRVCYDSLVRTKLAPETRTRSVKNNIYALRRAPDYQAQAVEIAHSFQLPWSLTKKLPYLLANRISDFLQSNYPCDAYRAFASGFDRYNKSHRRP